MALSTGTRPQDWLELPAGMLEHAANRLEAQAKAEAKAEAKVNRARAR